MQKDHSAKNVTRVVVICHLLAVSLLIGSVCVAQQADIPRISIQELKAMMDKGTEMTIIDAQPKDIYAEGHIKGAISIPWKSQIALEDVWSIPSDALIVTYCDCGPGEADSADIASQLIQMGYVDVKVLKDPSIRGWKEAGYPLEK
jgi:rhodanese-related sulfurtransferase